MSWEPVNLSSPEYATEPQPPAAEFRGLLYRGKRHIVSGPSESAKTLIVWALALEGLRAGLRVSCIDFEMGPTATRRLLVDLGATDDELAEIDYYEPTTPPAAQDIDRLAETSDLVIIDAAAGAYDVSNLDDNKRQDAERFARTWIVPLWQRNVATALVDHVTKNAETRGRYAIGSERKLGGCDVHLGIEVVGTPLTRGGSGLVKIHVHKDRPGFLPRPHAAEIHLESDAETHRITWTMQDATAAGDDWRPTRLMEKVSRLIESEPHNRAAIKAAVKGRTEYVVAAIEHLITDGYAAMIVPGEKGTKISSTRPFREQSFPEPNVRRSALPSRSENNRSIVPESFPSFPGTGVSPIVPIVPSPYRGDGNGNDDGNEPSEPTSDRPLPGDAGYLELLFAAFENGHVTENEWHQGERAHHLIGVTA